MSKRAFFFLFTTLSVLLGFLHLFALKADLYWILSWFDILMHLLGGLWLSFIAFALWRFVYKEEGQTKEKNLLFFIIIAVVVVGSAWEIYEYLTKVAFATKEEYVFDTSLDFVADFVGAFFGYFFIKNNNG